MKEEQILLRPPITHHIKKQKSLGTKVMAKLKTQPSTINIRYSVGVAKLSLRFLNCS